jgi:hypothetical protein
MVNSAWTCAFVTIHPTSLTMEMHRRKRLTTKRRQGISGAWTYERSGNEPYHADGLIRVLPLDPRDFDGNDNGWLRLEGGISNPGHLAGQLTSVLPDLPRAPSALANDAAVTEDEPDATVKLNRRRHGVPGSSSPAVPLTCHPQQS